MNPVPLTETLVLTALREIIDPEIGCNIVDLGLVYSVKITGSRVAVAMTLTTPGCPMHESIRCGVENALAALDGVAEARAEFVWDPPWNPSMMSDFGRASLGLAPF